MHQGVNEMKRLGGLRREIDADRVNPDANGYADLAQDLLVFLVELRSAVVPGDRPFPRANRRDPGAMPAHANSAPGQDDRWEPSRQLRPVRQELDEEADFFPPDDVGVAGARPLAVNHEVRRFVVKVVKRPARTVLPLHAAGPDARGRPPNRGKHRIRRAVASSSKVRRPVVGRPPIEPVRPGATRVVSGDWNQSAPRPARATRREFASGPTWTMGRRTGPKNLQRRGPSRRRD